MEFEVKFVPSAEEDLAYYRKNAQCIVYTAISNFLQTDPDVVTNKRKQLRANPLAPWELRVGDYRVFYEIFEETTVRILAVGHKEHNDLFIRGRRVEI